MAHLFDTATVLPPRRRPRRLSTEAKAVLDKVGFGGWIDAAHPFNAGVPVSAFTELLDKGFLTRPSAHNTLYRLTEKGRRYAGL